jgi:hypothetical protein
MIDTGVVKDLSATRLGTQTNATVAKKVNVKVKNKPNKIKKVGRGRMA